MSIEEDFPVGTKVRRKTSNTNNSRYTVGTEPFEVFGHHTSEYGEYGEYVSDEYNQWHSPEMIEKVPEPVEEQGVNGTYTSEDFRKGDFALLSGDSWWKPLKGSVVQVSGRGPVIGLEDAVPDAPWFLDPGDSGEKLFLYRHTDPSYDEDFSGTAAGGVVSAPGSTYPVPEETFTGGRYNHGTVVGLSPADVGLLSKVAGGAITSLQGEEGQRAKEAASAYLSPDVAAEEFAANTVKFLNAEIQNHVDPEHYKFGTAQVIDITRHLPFPEGNVIKYVARAGRKGDRLQDLYKAKQYLDWAIEDAEADK